MTASIFEGRMVDNEGENWHHNRPHTFLVNRVWKGPRAPVMTVYTGQGGGDCGYEFNPGEAYLVFADYVESGAVFATSICSRTAPISEAATDLQRLGEGLSSLESDVAHPASPEAPAADPEAGNASGLAWYVLSGIATGVVLHLFWHRRGARRSASVAGPGE